jgi:hypothetical protein
MVDVEMDIKVAGAIVAMGRKRERGFLLETGWLGGNGAGKSGRSSSER